MKDVSDECEPEWLDGEDPLFILYTSGSTGKPKVQHHGFKLLFFYSAEADLTEGSSNVCHLSVC